uniref:Myb-like domain-containing protein n=1 Tax=Clastoptera arizonana TaxID=38151 RepID=A0A1B6C066_9HEMI
MPKRKEVKLIISPLKRSHFNYGKWTYEEKVKLKEALNIYGVENVDKIIKYIQTRSPCEVNAKIKHYDLKANQLIKQVKINDFDKLIIYDDLIAKLRKVNTGPKPALEPSLGIVLKLLEELHNHPDPKKTKDIDFKQAYGWLYDCYNGNPIRKIDQTTSKFILEAFDTVVINVRSSDNSNVHIKKYFENLKDDKIKTYPSKKKPGTTKKENNIIDSESLDLTVLSKLLEDPNINPLNIPASCLNIKSLLDYY